MEALSDLVRSYLFRPHKVISPHEPISYCPKTPSMATLAGLPPELLLSIFDFLPLVDLICFSLCNHRLLELSRRQMNRLPHTQDDKLSVLNRLERDFPEYFACDFCKVLHRFDGSESFGLHEFSYQRTCPVPCLHEAKWFSDDFSLRTHFDWTHSPYRLLFIQIKLAMKRFHYGPRSGVSTDSLVYTQVRHFPKVALIMTRCVNLGPGLTPDDILWTTHIDRPKPGERIPEHLITNPRQCFEDIAPQSFRDLKSHNLAYLKNQRYKKAMRRASRDLYWVPYKESLKRRVYEFLVSFF